LASTVARIKIWPFTKPKSFGADPVPDGVEVTLQALDPMGDAIKVWGTFRFELFRYRMASGDRHGEMVQHWEQSIGSFEDQIHFWDRVTQPSRFQLGWEGTPLEPKHKYLLDVYFIPPEGERPPTANYVFEFNPDIETLKSAARATGPTTPGHRP